LAPAYLGTNGGAAWLDHAAPFLAPLLEALAPVALRAVLRWYARRRARVELTRHEYLLVWSRLVGWRAPSLAGWVRVLQPTGSSGLLQRRERNTI